MLVRGTGHGRLRLTGGRGSRPRTEGANDAAGRRAPVDQPSPDAAAGGDRQRAAGAAGRGAAGVGARWWCWREVAASRSRRRPSTELQGRMAKGAETARSITEKYLDRIATVDGQLRSVLETNPDALAQADALDAERKAGKVRSALHGIPVLLKDNIATKDRMHTTAGSLALMDGVVPADAGPGRAAARRRRGDPGEDPAQRMGQLSLPSLLQRVEWTGRPVPESLCAEPESRPAPAPAPGQPPRPPSARWRWGPRPTVRSSPPPRPRRWWA